LKDPNLAWKSSESTVQKTFAPRCHRTMRPVLIDDDPNHPSRIDDADANLSMEQGEATPRWVAPKRGAMSTPASVAARAGVPLSRSPLPGNSFAVPQGSDSGRSTPDPLRAFRAKGKAGSWNKDTDKGKLDSVEGKVLAELTRERELQRISNFMRLSTGGFPVSLNPHMPLAQVPTSRLHPPRVALNVGEGVASCVSEDHEQLQLLDCGLRGRACQDSAL
jgi:hypothetical protein